MVLIVACLACLSFLQFFNFNTFQWSFSAVFTLHVCMKIHFFSLSYNFLYETSICNSVNVVISVFIVFKISK